MLQSLKGVDAENIGYVIPTTVIHHFLSDYDTNGRYTGTPQTQTLTMFQHHVQIWMPFSRSLCASHLGPHVPRFKSSEYLASKHDLLLNTWDYGFPGFPSMGVLWQRLENPALRAFLKMQPDQKVNTLTSNDPEHVVVLSLNAASGVLGIVMFELV